MMKYFLFLINFTFKWRRFEFQSMHIIDNVGHIDKQVESTAWDSAHMVLVHTKTNVSFLHKVTVYKLVKLKNTKHQRGEQSSL